MGWIVIMFWWIC